MHIDLTSGMPPHSQGGPNMQRGPAPQGEATNLRKGVA